MKSFSLSALSWLLSMTISYHCVYATSQNNSSPYESDTLLARPALVNDRIHYQLSIGVSSTNMLFSGPNYSDSRVEFVRADVFALKSLTRRTDLRLGFSYEPVGYSYTGKIGNNEIVTTKGRLFFSNIQALIGYEPFRLARDQSLHILGGVFVGKLLGDDIISTSSPSGQVFINKSVSTYDGWNAGLAIGVSSTLHFNEKRAVGAKFMYQPRLYNIVTKEATNLAGSKRHTTLISLSVFLQL